MGGEGGKNSPRVATSGGKVATLQPGLQPWRKVRAKQMPRRRNMRRGRLLLVGAKLLLLSFNKIA